MKALLTAIIYTLATALVCAQLSTAATPTWRVTLKVVDEIKNPVASASVSVGYGTKEISGLTDTNGIFSASHRDSSYGLSLSVQKKGYYATRQTYELGWTYQYTEAKWHPTLLMTLRKMGNPVPMYAKRQELVLPKRLF